MSSPTSPLLGRGRGGLRHLAALDEGADHRVDLVGKLEVQVVLAWLGLGLGPGSGLGLGLGLRLGLGLGLGCG